MAVPRLTLLLAAGLTLSGCAGALEGVSEPSGQSVATAPGYYGTPVYPAQGYEPPPGYVTSYPYQPAYVAPYGYGAAGRESREREWREREWREHRERDAAYQRESRPAFEQQRRDDRRPPPMASQPQGMGQPRGAPPAPPPAASSQVDQNKRMIDQLGFRPSR